MEDRRHYLKPIPTSLSSITDDETAKEKGADSGFKSITLIFADEFSASESKFSVAGGPDSFGPIHRHLFYNDQITKTIARAVDFAVSLGMPRVDYSFGLGFVPVSDRQFQMVAEIARQKCSNLTEGSIEWLCLQVYLRWIQTCWTFTNPTELPHPPDMSHLPTEAAKRFKIRELEVNQMFDCILKLGAAARELELSERNREDALRGKKTVRSARFGGEMRKVAKAPTTEAVLAEMRRLIAMGKSVSSAAQIAFAAKHLGKSPQANRTLWYRHTK